MTSTNHHDDPRFDDGVRNAADHDRLHNDEVAHEHSDVSVRTVLVAALALALITAAVAAAMWGVFKVLDHQAASTDPQVSPVALPSGTEPPGPRLQTNEYAGLKTFREAETRALEGYGWVDEKGGVARMPIDQAKKLILERGLPSRAGGPVDPKLGTHAFAYGEANGGRSLVAGR